MLDKGAPEGSRPRGGLARYARDLAFTHACDGAKSLTQTLDILSEILSSQMVCLMCHIVPKINLRTPGREM